jgi:ferritin
MISKKMTAALNGQINKELYSSFLYLAMSAVSRRQNLNGMAQWLMLQAKEEYGHAMKFYGYMEEQGATIELKAIDAPPVEHGAPAKMFGEILKHEQFITRSIHELMKLAVKEEDFATQILLQWFVKEQVEEEAAAADVLAKLEMVGAEARGLYIVDRELGQRQGG